MTAKDRWALNEAAFERLLQTLDADPERAALRYEEIRRKLARFFEWRGCPPAEEHADEVLDRVARRLHEGIEILNVGAYCYGIARLLLREVSSRGERQRAAVADLTLAARAPAPDDTEMTCLEHCLARLDPESRAQILAYYDGERRDRQLRRKDMAARLGIAPNALRIRLHRVRRGLEECLMGCLDKDTPTGETNGARAPLRAGERHGNE